jgi:hypothetical protein
MTGTKALIEEAREANREYDYHTQGLINRLVGALEKAQRGARTLGEIVERQVEDTLRWAGMEDQIGLDDPDQQTAWELCAEMPDKIARLTRERDSALATIEKVRAAINGPHPANSGLDSVTLAHLSAILEGPRTRTRHK